MIRINLLTEGRGAKRPGAAGPRPAAPVPAEGAPPYILYAAIVLLTILGIAAYGGWLMMTNHKLAVIIADQRVELKKYEGAREKVAELEKKKAEYSAKLDQIKQLKDQQSLPVKLMNRLVEVLPDGAWYVAVREKESAIDVEGRAKSIKTISTLYDNLIATGDFSQVQLGEVVQQTGTEEVYSFKVNFSYLAAKPKPAEEAQPAAASKPAPAKKPAKGKDEPAGE